MLTFHSIYDSIVSGGIFVASFWFIVLGAITCYMRVKQYNPSSFAPFKIVIYIHLMYHLVFKLLDATVVIPLWFMTFEEILTILALVISIVFNGLFKGLWRYVLSVMSFIFLCWLTELFFISFWLALVIAIALYIVVYKILL